MVTKAVPGLDIGGGVLGGPVDEAVGDGDRPVSRHREDLDELEQVA